MRIFFWALIAVSMAVPAAFAQDRGRIAVRGEGVVSVAPDMAQISIGVSHEAREAKEAMARVGVDASAVLDRLDRLDIAAEDIQTRTVSLRPVWDHTQNGDAPRVRGYRAETQLNVRLRDLSQVSDLLDSVVTGGANQLGGLDFTIADPAPLQDDARVRAVEDARAKAEIYARAAGVQLGEVLDISEDGVNMPGTVMMEAAAMRSAPGVPISAGEIELRASVTMVFSIRGQ